MRAMTAEPTISSFVLRRLSPLDDLAGVTMLMAGYVAEIQRNLLEGYGLKLEEATPDSGQLVEIRRLLEPPQCLYLAEVDGKPAGTGGLKQVSPEVAEVKRMYVDRRFRGGGVARVVLERLVADAQAAGYRWLQLETAVWMVEAHGLYRRFGFVDAPPFPDPEFGCFPGFDHLARYMTLSLDG